MWAQKTTNALGKACLVTCRENNVSTFISQDIYIWTQIMKPETTIFVIYNC